MRTPPLYTLPQHTSLVWLHLRIYVLLACGWGAFIFLQQYVQEYIYTTLHQPRPPFIHVDATASETQNGSFQYPFASLQQALDINEQDSKFHTVLIAPGEYTESLELHDNINLLGIEPESPPIIHPDIESGNKITLQGYKNSTLYNIEIRGGKYNVYLHKNANANIINSTLTQSTKYAFFNEASENDSLSTIRFLGSEVSHSDSQGIYAQKAYFSVKNSLIQNNGEEGLDLHVGITAHVANNILRDNGESGIETEIGDNTLLIENNLILNNTKNGINVQSTKESGDIRLIRNTMKGNKKFGLRCAIHSSVSPTYFSDSVTRKFNKIHNNNANIDPNCKK